MSTATAPMRPDLLQTRYSLLSRLKDWRDDASWQEFFDTYWQLLYGVALKAGLTDAEARDAVQETLLTVAKNIAELKRDSSHGSFKGWLLHTTRWKIMDQLRKRPPARPHAKDSRPDDGTSAEQRVMDPASFDLDASWEQEWQRNLMRAALERVKRKASPQEVQIFDLCALRGVPVKEVAASLQLKQWKVYFAQKRIAGLLKREIKRLEQAGI